MSLLRSLAALAQTLCPESCPRCGEETPGGFCAQCRGEFPRIEHPCAACGLPDHAHRCPARDADWLIDRVRAPFLYAPPLSIYLQRLKFARQRRLGLALGQLLALEIAGNAPQIDLLIAVPLHPRRLRERSFNQADEIARPIARSLGIPLVALGIGRVLRTPAQTGLARGERLANLAQAFRVRRKLDGASVAIVDDVITTGATVNALAGALRAAGASRIEAFGVARTVGPEPGAAQAARNR